MRLNLIATTLRDFPRAVKGFPQTFFVSHDVTACDLRKHPENSRGRIRGVKGFSWLLVVAPVTVPPLVYALARTAVRPAVPVGH